MGDNLTGAGDGDDEQIQIDLSLVPANIEKIAFTVTIYDAESRRQNSVRSPILISISWTSPTIQS